MMKKGLFGLLIIFMFFSCNDMSKLKKECEEFTIADYRPDNLVIVNSADIKLNDVDLKTTYNNLIDNFGKEDRIGKGMLNGKEFDSYHFLFHGNYIQYMANENVIALTKIHFQTPKLIVNFRGELLNSESKLKDFRINEKEAFCNSIYYKQSEKYVLLYRGSVDNEIYELSFKKGKLIDLKVSWNNPPD